MQWHDAQGWKETAVTATVFGLLGIGTRGYGVPVKAATERS